jgi:hypothetical protein
MTQPTLYEFLNQKEHELRRQLAALRREITIKEAELTQIKQAKAGLGRLDNAS